MCFYTIKYQNVLCWWSKQQVIKICIGYSQANLR